MQCRVHAIELCDHGVWESDGEWAELRSDVWADEWTDRVLWDGEWYEAMF